MAARGGEWGGRRQGGTRVSVLPGHINSGSAVPCKRAMRSQAHSTPVGRVHGRFGAAYRVLQEAIEARAFPGCAFGVLADGQVALQDALGRFTYEEDAPAVTAETVYDVASLTKVVATTAAAMLLVQRGQIDLDTTAGRVAAGFCGGPGRGRSGAPRETAPPAGPQFGFAGLRGVFPHG